MSREDERMMDEENRIKVYITYQEKTVLFSANPKNSLRVTMDNMQKLANAYSDKYWLLPEIDENGQRITYFLGRMESKSIFQFTGSKGEELSLEKYGVRAGDKLRIIRKVVAG